MNPFTRNGSHPPPLPPVAEMPKLIIEMRPDGSVQVSGPITNRFMCYAMLESARDVIKDYKPSPIIPVL